MSKCGDCGLPDERIDLCDNWCCRVFGPPVTLSMTRVELDGNDVLISSNLVKKIEAILKETANGR